MKATCSRIGIILFATSLIAGCASTLEPKYAGAGETKRLPKSLAKLDSNKDHHISRGEAASKAKISKNFRLIDKNGDGYISGTEYREYRKLQKAKK